MSDAGTEQAALAEPCSLPAQVINHRAGPSRRWNPAMLRLHPIRSSRGARDPSQSRQERRFPALCSAGWELRCIPRAPQRQQQLHQGRDPHSLLAGKTPWKGDCATELPAAVPGESISPLEDRLQVTAKPDIPPVPAADASVGIQGYIHGQGLLQDYSTGLTLNMKKVTPHEVEFE